MTPNNFLVLGAGSWGTALALVLSRNGHHVYLWGHDAQHIQELQRERCNRRYLPEIVFPDTLQPITDFTTLSFPVRDVLIVVPSHAFRQILQQLAPHLTPDARLCWATKGLEEHSGQLLHHVVAQEIGAHYPMAVLSGPSFAGEVARELPTAVTIASSDGDYANELVQWFHNRHFRPYTSTDIIGVQAGGAVKNAIAIAVGMADGMGLGANTRAALITRGLLEMVRLGTYLGGQRETFMGLAGLGDLLLTCTDNQSRNRRLGYAIAQGHSIDTVVKQLGQVVEGISAACVINRLAQQHAIDMPIVHHVQRVLTGQCTPQQAAVELLSRDPKPELT
ncbi:NAD(P)H-dependent glycerol-3-phosphate dehydrogenase [Thioflexithrix psekupsensis]|uniref:Glycerol-3-phosphate dehydrogenase [NAD(P)+] n=1 Tax=Thioflexithrix psekupsensis TaxID=1570016 RepID=A0A251XC38_9GAMM|nr:NAD(P)H-dependent glycerol-3-phosphate dehydrogenase [Thioflexithrix psekupsensis]OUD15650.1 glycerol-3-phosphate dehydrogenase [Thioflexithrix psekupsensis]